MKNCQFEIVYGVGNSAIRVAIALIFFDTVALLTSYLVAIWSKNNLLSYA